MADAPAGISLRWAARQTSRSQRAWSAPSPQTADELDASCEGTDLTVAVNPDYLASGVEAATSEEVTLETLDALKPAVVRSVGSDDFLYLLMPVRVP